MAAMVNELADSSLSLLLISDSTATFLFYSPYMQQYMLYIEEAYLILQMLSMEDI
jgi:hypothetical protein